MGYGDVEMVSPSDLRNPMVTVNTLYNFAGDERTYFLIHSLLFFAEITGFCRIISGNRL